MGSTAGVLTRPPEQQFLPKPRTPAIDPRRRTAHWALCGRPSRRRPLDQTLYLEGSITIGLLTLNAGDDPDAAEDCLVLRALLDKRDVVSGKKRASEPLFNLAAQLVSVKLNLIAGAGFCPALTTAVSQADTLLINKSFTGTDAKANLNPTQAALANQLAQTLDSYNNNTLCP